MLDAYIPENFCKEYTLLKPSQLPMFMATVKGVKPLMDDWIPIQQYGLFKQICKKYKVYQVPDCIFVKPTEEQVRNAIDGHTLTTTKFLGMPFNKDAKSGEVHVFISKSKKTISEAHKYGWYPVIVRGRAIQKPFVDHMRFGKLLGYPDCCIDFFRLNNKAGVSHLYTSFKNTAGEPSYYCNNSVMDFNYSFIHHIPCSFNCKNTIKLAKEIEKAIAEEEPEFARKIVNYLKKPLLVFGERNMYLFDGESSKNKIRYENFYFLGREEDNKYRDRLKLGNSLKVSDSTIEIYSDNQFISEIKKEGEEDGFILNFKNG